MSHIDKFIKKAIMLHGSKYDYSETEYLGCKRCVKIVCSIHGTFNQTPDKHLCGHGCPKCGGSQRKTNFNFILDAKKIHGNKYDYSLINYIGIKNEVKIICSIHGLFEQTPDLHLRGCGCPKCGYVMNGKNSSSTTNNFIIKANIIHKNKYDYSQVNYINAKTKIKISCEKHGLFEQSPTNHLAGKGCLKCKESRGEMAIKHHLNIRNVDFITEKTFYNCKNVNVLPFDFYLPKQNLLIEFDGKQHYEQISYFGGIDAFTNRQKNDNIKTKFAEDNDIALIRIKFDEINNIENILNKIL